MHKGLKMMIIFLNSKVLGYFTEGIGLFRMLPKETILVFASLRKD